MSLPQRNTRDSSHGLCGTTVTPKAGRGGKFVRGCYMYEIYFLFEG